MWLRLGLVAEGAVLSAAARRRAADWGKLNTLGNQGATNVLSFGVGRSVDGWLRALPGARDTIGAHGGP